jgi:hypothetical protein
MSCTKGIQWWHPKKHSHIRPIHRITNVHDIQIARINRYREIRQIPSTAPTIAVVPAASPSKPSVKFTPFETAEFENHN